MRRFLRDTYLYILLVPVGLIVLGAALNQAVMIANGDTFPVLVNSVKSGGQLPGSMLDNIHSVMSSGSRLRFLGDIFDFGPIESIGDLLIELGSWLWSYAPAVWMYAVIRRLIAL
jgi:hypothetical protein